MCDHRQHVSRIERRQVSKSTPPENTCNIYYIHQDGSMFWERNVAFNSSEECLPCGEDRLTLIQLPGPPISSETESSKNSWPDSYPSPAMPSIFETRLKNICPHCPGKGRTAWRNIHRPDSHFDTSFRFVDEAKYPENRCFLGLYTMRVPLMADRTVAVSIVHHIRVEGGKLISANGTQGENKEQIFGFVAGFDSIDIGILFANLISQWQDSVSDHLKTCSGMTPKLFMAAIISQYHSVVRYGIISTGQSLKALDSDLQTIVNIQKSDRPGSYKLRRAAIHGINESLITLSKRVNGWGPELHYLANSNDALVASASRFKEFMEACVKRWNGCDDRQDLLKELQQLDSTHELARDKNQLEVLAKSIDQCQEEAQSVLEHINIDFGIVRGMSGEIDRSIQLDILNHTARDGSTQLDILENTARDGLIQLDILKNTARDGSNMKVLAVLTALFLPGTFMAIVLTTPMFNWVDTEKSTLVKLPFEIWMGFTGSVTILLIIGLALMSFVDWSKVSHMGAKSFDLSRIKGSDLQRNLVHPSETVHIPLES